MVARGTCDYNFKAGWWCSRGQGHDGPCALRKEITYRQTQVMARGSLFPTVQVTVCDVCEAFVMDAARHTGWHDNGCR